MDIFFIIVFFIFGTVFGSFFNVVGLRLPKKKSFTKGRSFCPTCQNKLSYYELIPIFSYIIQRGRCRHCKKKISFIYLMTELITGIVFALSYSQIGFSIELIMALLLMSMLIIIFVTDINYMLIPNKILLFFLPIFIVLRIVEPLDPWHSSITGAIVGYLLIALIIVVSKGGMGAGDMKLFGVLGIVIGLAKVLLTFFIASLFGAIVGGILMAFKIIDRKQPIPFGPYIVFGAIVTYFYGGEIFNFYLSLLS